MASCRQTRRRQRSISRLCAFSRRAALPCCRKPCSSAARSLRNDARSVPMRLWGWRGRAAIGKGQYFKAGIGDEEGVLVLRRQAVVFGDYGQGVGEMLGGRLAGVDHRFDGEGHAGLEPYSGPRAAVMQHLRLFMELPANAVSAKVAHYAVTQWLDEALDGMANVAQISARLDYADAAPHRLPGDLAQASGQNRRPSSVKHPAAVAVITILDDGDVDVHDVAVPERFIVGHAVADLMVDRGANRFWIRLMSAGRVIQRRGDGVLHIDDKVMAQLVQLIGRYARLGERGNVVKHFAGQAAGDAHFFDFLRGLDGNGHLARAASGKLFQDAR